MKQYFTNVHNGQSNFLRNLIHEGIAVFMTRLHIQKNRVKKFAIINLKSLIWVAKYTKELQCLYSLSLIGNIKANKI